MKTWVIQDNLISVEQSSAVATAVTADGGKVYPVSLIPFSDEINFWEELPNKDVIVYGSTRLSKLAEINQWTGLFFNDNFNTKSWNNNRDDMLNYDGQIVRVDCAASYLGHCDDEEILFIRPIHDLKAFAGTVTTAKEIKNWMNSVDSGSFSFGPETLVSIASPKNIDAEWRWFIVDGKVVDGSLYRHSGRRSLKHEDDQSIIDEAQSFADKWLPHKNCVMDLALTSSGVKVIEFNCINSSGFYDNDIAKIVYAINRSF